jgi:hypothetical protein
MVLNTIKKIKGLTGCSDRNGEEILLIISRDHIPHPLLVACDKQSGQRRMTMISSVPGINPAHPSL